MYGISDFIDSFLIPKIYNLWLAAKIWQLNKLVNISLKRKYILMLRALESPERAHTLLIGPPACAKSLLMLEIEKGMQ